jgi:prophage regulatory protein
VDQATDAVIDEVVQAQQTPTPKPDQPPTPTLKFLTKKQVLEKIPVTAPTLWTWVRQGKFPKPRSFGVNRVFWIEEDVDQWIRSQPVRVYKPWAGWSEG